MIAVLVLTLIGLSPAQPTASSPRDRAEIAMIGPMLAAIDSDSDIPSKEYGFLRNCQEDESQEEDGDGDDAKAPRAEWSPIALHLGRSSRPTLSASTLHAIDLGSMPRVSCLRC